MKLTKGYLREHNIEFTTDEDGNLTVGGSLDLRRTNITSLPDNLTVGGYLDLRRTNITSLPDNLTVMGYLDLEGANITSLPDNLTVGGFLDLEGANITSLPDNLTVGGDLDLSDTNITSLPDNLTVGDSLDLSGTNITSLPDNLTVGGFLALEGANITSLPDNLTVGGWLDLSDTNITSLPDNLTVGGSLYLSDGSRVKPTGSVDNDDIGAIIESKFNGTGYTLADGVLAKLIRTKGNVSKVRIVGQLEESYLVTDGEGNYAHGGSLEEAKADLVYKKIASDDVNIPAAATGAEWVAIYRAVTGACSSGVKHFVKTTGKDLSNTYTLQEILELTEGQYGHEKLKQRVGA